MDNMEESDEYIVEYIDEEFLAQVAGQSYEIPSIKQEITENAILPNSTLHNDETMSVKKAQKRKQSVTIKGRAKKLKVEKSTNEEIDISEIRIGNIITLYAYKDCLGKFDSLLKNNDIALWYRDKSFLFQKFLRQKIENHELFYYSTNSYSLWEDERKDEYLEIKAIILFIQNGNVVVKILDLENIEIVCMNGNFASLGLVPYVNYQMRLKKKFSAKEEEEDVGGLLFKEIDTSNGVEMMEGESSKNLTK